MFKIYRGGFMTGQVLALKLHTSVRRNTANFIFTFLGLLTAFGPFVTDMYLPSLPALTVYFNAPVSLVQMGLTSSMLGLALGQLLFGPLSDKYGRRRPLLYSLYLFIVSTVLCIFAPNIEAFVALRFLQGVAASGGIVIARSVAADKFKNGNLSKALAIVGAINGIAPIAAPVVGGMMLGYVGWRGIFLALLVIGFVLLGFCLNFNESLSRSRRSSESLLKTLKNVPLVFANRRFLYYTLELSFALAILFAYIASSPFVIQNHYGFSPFAFSLFFAANAVAIGIGAASSVKFGSAARSLKVSCAGMVAVSLGLAAAMASGAPVAVYEGLLFVLCFMLGMSFTVATAGAMNAERARAGTGSAVLGAMGFLFGSVVSPLVGLGDIILSTGLVLTVCALAASFCARRALHA